MQRDVEALLQSGNIGPVAAILDARHLQLESVQLPPTWPYALHLLAHLYHGNLEDARLLWMQIPDSAKQEPEVQACHALLQRLWRRDFQGIWGVAAAFAWSASAQLIVTALSDQLQERVMGLLTQAYSTLASDRAAAYLGITEPEAITRAHRAGWTFDASTGFLTVHRTATPCQPRTKTEHLQRLIGYSVPS